MDVLEYLGKHQFYNTEYITLLESKSTIIDKELHEGLYNYFFNVRGGILSCFNQIDRYDSYDEA